jgi:GAF domain-containing protein
MIGCCTGNGAFEMNQHVSMDAAQAFAELGRINLSQDDLTAVLVKIATLAERVIPGARSVSVTLLQGEKATAAAFTDELARGMDESQYEKGYGPCLEAAQAGMSLVVDDMKTEDRWPDFARHAAQRGVHSSLSVGLPVQQAVTGGLNLYGSEAHAFDDEAIELARTFASYAAVALANAHLYASTAALAEQMQHAMATRAVIEQAKGILMALHRCDEEAAFDLLRGQSQKANRKLRDVAADVVARARGAEH